MNNGKPHASIEHYGGNSNKLFGRIDSPANGPARSSEYLKPPISPHQNNFGVRFHNDSKHTINEVSECISDRSSPFLTAEGIIGTSKPVKLSGQQGPLVIGPIPLNTIQNSAKLCKISVSKASMPKMKRNKPKNSVTAKEHKLSNRDTQQEPDSCGFRGFKNARFVGKKSLQSRAAPAGVKKAEDEELGFSTQSKESSDLDSTIIKGKSFGSGTRKKICDFDSEPEGEQHPQYRSEGSNSEDVIISIQGTGGARGAQLGLTVFDQSMQHMLRSQLSLRRVHGKTPNPLELQKIQTLSESDAANLFSSSKLYPRQDTGLSSSTQGKQRNVASATNKKKFDPSFGQTTEKLSPISKQKQSEPILNVKYSPLLIGKSYNRETIKSNLMIPTVHELNFEVPDFRKIQASRNAKSSERRPSEQSEYSNWGQARASQTSTLSTYKILDGLLSAPKLSNALSTHGPGPSGKPLSKPTSSKLDSSLTPGPHPVGSSPSRQSPPGLSSPKRHSATGFFQRTNEETSLLDLIKQRSLSRGSIEPPNRERELLEASWSGLGGFHHWPGSSPLKHPSLGQAGASGHKLIRPSPQPKQTDSHGKIRSLSKLINSIGG